MSIVRSYSEQETRMHIVLLESGHEDRKIAIKFLRSNFPIEGITVLRSVEEFLLQENSLKTPYTLITENYLTLLELRESREDFDRRHKFLETNFPWIKNWNHQEAGERLIRYIREKNNQTSIVIYTHSDQGSISPDILNDPKVRYLSKEATDSEDERLRQAIYSF